MRNVRPPGGFDPDAFSPEDIIAKRASQRRSKSTWENTPPRPASYEHETAEERERRPPLQPTPGEVVEAVANADDPWEAPIPFSGHDVPAFPVDALPPAIGDFVRAEAEATQTPPDMAAMLCLAAFSSAIAKRVVVEVKDGYVEPVNLFVAVVLPPGERKSQVMKDVLAPIVLWEREAAVRAEPEIRRAMQRFKISEKRLAAAEARAAGNLNREARERAELEAQQLADEHAVIKVPVAPRNIVDDVTPEALVSFMAEQGGRAAQFSAEGGVFSMLAGRYSSAPNLDPYLKGHAGEPIRVDRKGRETEHIDAPALTVGVALQPAVLESFAEQPMFRGVGLLARFLYSLPESRLGVRNVDPKPVAAAVRERYAKLMTAALSLSDKGVIKLKLSPEARGAYHDFARWVEPQLSEFGDLAMVRDWAAKLSGVIVRISGIVSIERLSKGLSSLEISLEDIEKATAIGRYLVPHALSAFSAMGADPKVESAKQVLRCIERNGWTEFTHTKMHQALKGSARFEHSEQLDEPLKALGERGYLRRIETERTGKAGRPKTPTYLVNPGVFSKGNNPKNPENGVRDAG